MRTAKTFLSNVRKKKVGIAAIDMPLLDMRRVEDLIGPFFAVLILRVLSFAHQARRENFHERQAQGIAPLRPEVPTP